jgi:NAD(P)-dependent dehydrogenase (short-subunit alcohol dehydrogenase family)
LQRRPHKTANIEFRGLNTVTTTRRNAVVTGAASGLGRALAVRLAADGWRIAVADIDRAGSEETLRLIESAGGAGQVEQLDVTQLEQWESLLQRLRSEWSDIDLLVNNAGVAGCGSVGTFPIEDWHWLLNINLYGAIHGCHTFIDWLRQNPNGSHIINAASFAAIAPTPSMAAYNVAKAGVVALSETLYSELKPHGVGVTVLCPMYFHTNIQNGARSYDETTVRIWADRTQRSTLTAEDVADAAIRAMRRGQFYVVPGRQARWYWWLRHMAPTWFLDGIARDAAKWERANTDSS